MRGEDGGRNWQLDEQSSRPAGRPAESIRGRRQSVNFLPPTRPLHHFRSGAPAKPRRGGEMPNQPVKINIYARVAHLALGGGGLIIC